MKFSVVIPLYNKEKHIMRAVRSVLNQSFQAHELIIIDDGSTDQSALLVKSISNEIVKLICQENEGASRARNRGIIEAKGDYVAFLDADDQWDEDFLYKASELINNYPEAGAYGLGYRISNLDDIQDVEYKYIPKEMEEGIVPRFFRTLLDNSPIWTSAAIVRRDVFKKVGMFKVGEIIGEDVEMWSRIAISYPIVFTKDVKATYYTDAANRTYIGKNLMIKPSGYLKTLREFLDSDKIDEETKFDIKKLIDDVELSHCIHLILAKKSKEARRCLAESKFTYCKMQKVFWYPMSFIPTAFLKFLLKIKAQLRQNEINKSKDKLDDRHSS